MTRPSARILAMIAASALAWDGPARCMAQSPAVAAATDPSPREQPRASLPTTVSPVLERFMKRKGRDLPPPGSPVAPAAADGRPGESLPLPPPVVAASAVSRASTLIPPPIASSAVNPRASQDVRDRPATAPSSGPPGGSANLVGAPSPRPSPLATRVNLKAAPHEPTDLRFPINLATALRLSDARPLIVATAQASVWVAEADLQQARVLWVPTLNVAADYLRHDGGGPDFNKGIMTAPSVNFFYGGIGLWGFISSTDVLFQPLAARQVLNSRHWDIQAAKNDALFQTADAYFQVHQYRGTYAGTLYCIEQGHRLIEKLATLSRDMVPGFEVDRARNLVADLEQRAVSARQQWRISSANLTQVLRLDPRAMVEPLEPDHLQVTLIEPGRTLEELMPIALSNRPEIASRQALIQAATARIRREKMRPILPGFVLSGYQSPGGMLIQAGMFGMGPNSSMSQWVGRDDVSLQLVWQLEYLGFGNLAQIKRQRGEQSRATVDLLRAQDMVVADVTRAHARVQSAAARVLQADRALRTGIINLNGNFEGLKEISRFANVLVLVSRPQEAVYALQLLNRAYDEYFTTVAEYNRAQFDLFHAMGYPAYEITARNLPGSLQEVDLARPKYLPPVGHGPPPATR